MEDKKQKIDDERQLKQALEDMKDQLIIVLVERLGGDIIVPVSEIDNTGGKLLMMGADLRRQEFRFTVEKKH